MKFQLNNLSSKVLVLTTLIFTSIFVAGTVFASLNFSTNTLTGSGAINISPTGQPVTINGDLTVTGACTGCGGAPGGSDTQIQFNDGGALAGSANLTWDNATEEFAWRNTEGNKGVTTNRYSGTYALDVFSFGPGANITALTAFAGTDDTGGDTSAASAADLFAYSEYDGDVGSLTGIYLETAQYGSGTVTDMYGFYNYTQRTAGVVTNAYAEWVGDTTGAGTNAYAYWYDSPGVYRIKSDGVMAYYNPTFTQYTPGAANFERIVQQWNGNVAEYGTEVGAGGGNVLRNLRLIGQDIKPNPIGFFYVHEAVKTAAPDAADCNEVSETNRVVFDSTSDNVYYCSGVSGWRKTATTAP